MKKFLTIICLALLPAIAFAQELQFVEFDNFTIKLPEGSAYNTEMSEPDQGMTVWSNPDGTCHFFYLTYTISDDKTQEQRLVEEAAGMGVTIEEVADQIVGMKLSDDLHMSIASIDQLAIGVVDFDPANKLGMAFFVVAPQAPADDPLVLQILTSLRLK